VADVFILWSIKQKKNGQVGNAFLYIRYRVNLGHRVSHNNGCVKFEFNDRTGIIVYEKMIQNGDNFST